MFINCDMKMSLLNGDVNECDYVIKMKKIR